MKKEYTKTLQVVTPKVYDKVTLPVAVYVVAYTDEQGGGFSGEIVDIDKDTTPEDACADRDQCVVRYILDTTFKPVGGR